MVQVRVAVQQDLHLLGVEAQGLDVGQHLRRGRIVTPVEEDQAGRRRDEVGGDVAGPDIVEIVGDPERGDRVIARRGGGESGACEDGGRGCGEDGELHLGLPASIAPAEACPRAPISCKGLRLGPRDRAGLRFSHSVRWTLR